MPTAETLRALLALVEEAKAGSEELDARIWQATQPDRKVMLDAGVAFGPGEKRDATFGKLREFPMDGWTDYKAVAASIEAPPLTTSIDAALALVAKVLPGWSYELRCSGFGGFAFADLHDPMEQPRPGYSFTATHSTGLLPLVILAALLRALLQQSEPPMSSAETTATFTYEPANELAPLKVGDTVEVVNSQGTAVGRYKVRRVESLVITTECGRLWTRSHGEWVSEFRGKKVVSWPFPSIRKVTASAARSFVEKSVKEAGHGE